MMEPDPKPKRVYTTTGIDRADTKAYWREYNRRRRQDPAYREKKAKWNKDWATAHADKQADYVRRNELSRYRITVEDYNTMAVAQGNRCAICGAQPKAKRLFVDHCHKTGRIRKLLCQHCNSMLGMAKDNPETLEAGAAYLRVHA